MFDYEAFKRTIKILNEIHPEWNTEIEKNWNILTDILSNDIDATIEFFDNKCTPEELVDASSVFDDVIDKTQNKELLKAMHRLVDKYKDEPDIIKYYIKENMIYAEQALKL